MPMPDDFELYLDTDNVGMDIHLTRGRRKMRWEFDSGEQNVEEFAQTLRDILTELGETDFAHYVKKVDQAVKAGAPVIDPREGPESPELQARVEAARAVQKGDEEWADHVAKLPEFQPSPTHEKARALAAAIKESKGRGTSPSERWGPKSTDRYV